MGLNNNKKLKEMSEILYSDDWSPDEVTEKELKEVKELIKD